jgi:hypothetical protein
MKQLSMILFTCLIMIFTTAQGHEGHDHGAPTFQPPKGGILQTALHGHFELVNQGNKVQVYVYDMKGNAKETKGLTITAELELPRKKAEKINLVDKGNSWEAEIDSKGAHRFTLKLTIDDGKEKDYVKFTVEK